MLKKIPNCVLAPETSFNVAQRLRLPLFAGCGLARERARLGRLGRAGEIGDLFEHPPQSYS